MKDKSSYLLCTELNSLASIMPKIMLWPNRTKYNYHDFCFGMVLNCSISNDSYSGNICLIIKLELVIVVPVTIIGIYSFTAFIHIVYCLFHFMLKLSVCGMFNFTNTYYTNYFYRFSQKCLAGTHYNLAESATFFHFFIHISCIAKMY